MTVSTRWTRSKVPSSARRTDSAFSAHQRAASARGFDGDPGTDDALVHHRTGEIPWELPGCSGHPSVNDHRIERFVGWVRAREPQPELFQPRFEGHRWFSFIGLT